LPSETDDAVIAGILGETCDLRAFDAEFRARSKSIGPAAAFDATRKVARARRELTDLSLLIRPHSASAAARLGRWGCRVKVVS